MTIKSRARGSRVANISCYVMDEPVGKRTINCCHVPNCDCILPAADSDAMSLSVWVSS